MQRLFRCSRYIGEVTEMTDQEAYKIIGERMQVCADNPQVQREMVRIAKTEGKEKAEQWLFYFALATLIK